MKTIFQLKVPVQNQFIESWTNSYQLTSRYSNCGGFRGEETLSFGCVALSTSVVFLIEKNLLAVSAPLIRIYLLSIMNDSENKQNSLSTAVIYTKINVQQSK